MSDCPFCARILAGDVVSTNSAAVAFPDAYPVADGHTLVCPRQHVEDLFALNSDAWGGVWSLVRHVQRGLSDELGAPAWNIGVNAGAAAGQTVSHAHVHLIPRRAGDVADPRGGVRWVLPDRADYWSDR
jgi:diadenosine tetraphosphate (Ap4A) HIT family hydrolase